MTGFQGGLANRQEVKAYQEAARDGYFEMFMSGRLGDWEIWRLGEWEIW
jgi:hypothetical protein